MKQGDKAGLIIGVLVIALGLGGAVLYQRSQSADGLPARPERPALQELTLLAGAGEWEQRGFTKYSDANRTADFTAHERVYWALGGRWQIAETIYDAAGRADHELSIKTFNNATGTYQYVLCTDNGNVVGFHGRWMELDKAFGWEPVFPTTNSPPMSVQVREIIPQPDRRRVHSQYRSFATVLKDVSVDATRRGEGSAASPLPAGKPAAAEWAVLGQAGTWGERQTLKDSRGATGQMRVRGRARWVCNGRCLLFEGVVVEAGDGARNVPILWVKTFDKAAGVYRYAYFWENGQVDHYHGRWDPAAKTLTWRSVRLDAGEQMTCEFEETLPQPNIKRWKYKMREHGKVIVEGTGESRLQDEP